MMCELNKICEEKGMLSGVRLELEVGLTRARRITLRSVAIIDKRAPRRGHDCTTKVRVSRRYEDPTSYYSANTSWGMRLVRRVYSGRLSSLWENERSPSHAALAREENNRNRARFACIDLSQLSRFPCPSFPSEGNRDDRGGQWTAQIRLDKAEGAVLGRAGPGKRAEIQPYWLPSECIAYLLTGLTRGLYYGTARRCPLQLSASAQRCSSA
eukprot:7802896-Pyramimonas_sp.AAC.1